MRAQPDLALIARLQGMIHDCLRRYLVDDEPLAILDFPDIRNCGDSAIWLGEMAYLAGRGRRPAYVSGMREVLRIAGKILSNIGPSARHFPA